MKKELKKEQIETINSKQNLIVSANAGSGKTFVMLQRVVNFVAENNCSVLDFLLITFTDAAAGQMRQKLQRDLLKKYNDLNITKEQKEHIKKELSLISQADISTIHTFCYKIIKKYFYVVNLSASVSICDEELAKALQEKAMQNTLNYYTSKVNEDFLELFSSYDSKRNFSTIKEIILKIFKHTSNETDKDSFRKKVESVYEGNFENSKICEIINDYVCEIFEYYNGVFEQVLNDANYAGFQELAQNCELILKNTKLVSRNNSFRENHNIIFNKFSKFPQKFKAKEGCEDLMDFWAEQKSSLVAEIKEIKTKYYLTDDINKLKQDLLWCKKNVKMLIEMEETFAQKYDELKRQRNLLDFEDLEHYALNILKDKNIRDEISQTYKHIFVDEYQDVNNIQEAIINSLWNEKYNTLFLVGDPKQSIYRFRNTNPKIMLNKLETFCGDNKKSINLLHNFRSNENILSFVNFVFSKIMTEKFSNIDYQKTGLFLKGLEDFKKNDLPVVELNVIKTSKKCDEKVVPTKVYSVLEAEIQNKSVNEYAKQEAFVIASKISELISSGHLIYDVDFDQNNGLRKINYSDIAILYRSKGSYLKSLFEELKKFNIPLKSVNGENVLEEYEIQVLINYLKLINTSQDEYALVGFLTSPIVDMSFEELGDLREDNDLTFFEIVKQNISKNKKIEYAFSLVDMGKENLYNESIYKVLANLIEKTNYESLIGSLENGESRVFNVRAYVNSLLTNSYNNDLVAYLSSVEDGDELKIEDSFSGQKEAVNIVTMHHSKGLEYPIVFMVDMAHEFSSKDLSGPCLFSSDLGIGVQKFDKENRYKSSTIARSAIIVDENKKRFAEELRILYVGLTRAKNHLYITGRAKLDNLRHNVCGEYLRKQNNYMSIILSCLKDSELEAMRLGKEKLTIKTENDNNFIINVYEPNEECDDLNVEINHKAYNFSTLSDEIEKNIIKIESNISKELKKSGISYKSSVSRIMEKEDNKVSYSSQPQKFLLNEDKVSADEIGVAYHKAMEIVPLNLESKEEIEKFLSQNLTFDVFNLIDCEKIFKCVKYLQKWVSGADKIIREGKFYLNIPYNKIVKSSDVSDNILIQGVVDLVVIKGENAILIDYKTNRQKNDDIMREKYEIQLDCYKIAVENALKKKVTCKILYSFFKDCEILFDK
ncbi:MAG: UvrD-helicase domain-containing protein [Clostridia bacterium]|nr:UvrD-helicase domain-containing protein [Clostridia bacterium]